MKRIIGMLVAMVLVLVFSVGCSGIRPLTPKERAGINKMPHTSHSGNAFGRNSKKRASARRHASR